MMALPVAALAVALILVAVFLTRLPHKEMNTK